MEDVWSLDEPSVGYIFKRLWMLLWNSLDNAKLVFEARFVCALSAMDWFLRLPFTIRVTSFLVTRASVKACFKSQLPS